MDSNNFDLLALLQGFRDGRVLYQVDEQNSDSIVYCLVEADADTGAEEGGHAESIGFPDYEIDERTRIAG